MAQWTLADRDYDADWFRDGLEEKGIRPRVPGRRFRREPVKYDEREYKRRNLIEIMFGRLKDWRRVITCYDRCPTAFFSAVCLAATFMILVISPDSISKVSIPNAPSRSSAGQRSQDHFLPQCRPRPSTVRLCHEPVGQILLADLPAWRAPQGDELDPAHVEQGRSLLSSVSGAPRTE